MGCSYECNENKTYWTSTLNFLNENVGWMQSGGAAYFTNDGGKNWKKEYGIMGSSNIPDISAMSIVDQNNVWAVSSNGRIFKMIPGTITDIKEIHDALPQTIYLSQNYPNPFNPSTTIKFSIPNSQFAILKVYDILGP